MDFGHRAVDDGVLRFVRQRGEKSLVQNVVGITLVDRVQRNGVSRNWTTITIWGLWRRDVTWKFGDEPMSQCSGVLMGRA